MFKNRILYFILVVLAVLYAILYNEYDSSIVLFLAAALPILSFICLIIHSFCLDINVILPIGAAAKKKEIPITFELGNRSFLPMQNIDIVIYYKSAYSRSNKGFPKKCLWHSKKIITASVDGRSTTNITAYISSEYSGCIYLHIKKLKIMGYLGLISITKSINELHNIPVLPDIYPIEEPIVMKQTMDSGSADRYSSIRPGDDPSEVFDIRDYQDGDKIQRVHWKLSWKRKQFMVKEYSLPIDTSAVLLVEMGLDHQINNNSAVYSAILETVLSLSYALIQQEYMHYIIYYNSEEDELQRYPIMCEEDIYEVMEALIYLPVYQGSRVLKEAEILYQQERFQYCGFISSSPIISPLIEFVETAQVGFGHYIYIKESKPPVITESLEHFSVSVIDMEHIEKCLNEFEMG